MHNSWTMRLMSAFIAGLAVIAGAPAQAEDAVLVIDASGSMWGQIEEEAKITIAKRVLGEILADLPADRRIGLIAYGHRREGDCGDIEELTPVGGDRAAIAAAVKALNPKGKTPMAASVKLAAEKLKYTEEKATVILVSDGIETCEPDPCGVAAALEAAGADFTVHVVGFDVTEENAQAQLRCIAENTGGKFVAASDASELGEALEATVMAEAVSAPETTLYLRATELEGGVVIEKGLVWRVTPDAGGEPVIAEDAAGRVDAVVPAGTYDVTVERPSDGLKGAAEDVVLQDGAHKTVTIALTFPVSATLSPEPASTGVGGEPIKVGWTGPDRTGDYIAISEKGADPGAQTSYQYTARGTPAEIRLPVEPGAYEIRYMLGRPIRVLATADFTVTEATATLTGPETALAGEAIEVEFTGPVAGPNDYITIAAPDAPDAKYTDYHYANRGGPAELRAPLDAGAYELRYVQNGKKVLARRPINVTAAAATLDGPETAIAGESLKIAFTGPEAGPGDWITVAAPDAPDAKYTDYHYANRGSPADLRMPLEAGDYELRYVQGGKKVLARRPIAVTAATATLAGPATVIAGAPFKVDFTGPPAGSNDWVVVAATDAPDTKYDDYHYANRGAPAELRAPLDAGSYELRYVQGAKKVLAREALTVTAASATLDAPATAAADTVVDIGFTGPPSGPSDYVMVSEKGSADKDYVNYAYTANGSPAKLRMPKEAGDYEIRFVQASKKVLARQAITVTTAE